MKEKKKYIGVVMALFMVVSLFSTSGINIKKVEAEETDYGLSNPRIAYNSRDCIYFGNYWQEDTNGDGIVDQTDDKQPIKWQILSQNGDDVFLLADKIIDYKMFYEDDYSECTWEKSSIRAWLNGINDYSNSSAFINEAFSFEEQSAIIPIENENKSMYYDEYGQTFYVLDNKTTDKVYLLSFEEVKDISYKFSDTITYDWARMGLVTGYFESQWEYLSSDGAYWWWLRSPMVEGGSSAVDDAGCAIEGDGPVNDELGVRPAMHLNTALASGLYKNSENVNVSIKGTSYNTVKFGQYGGKDLIWRVLHVEGNDAFLLADSSIDSMQYNDIDTSITWKDCSLRSWLNNDFYTSAFSSDERSMIKTMKISNVGNSFCNTIGGEDTEDNVYLLSAEDIINPAFGFPSVYRVGSESRQAKDINDNSLVWWWLRSPGDESDSAVVVMDDGYVYYESGSEIDYSRGILPTLHIDLSSQSWLKGSDIILGDVTGATEQNGPSENAVETTKIDVKPSSEPTATKEPISTDIPTPTITPNSLPTNAPSSTPTSKPTQKPTTEYTDVPFATPTIDPTEKVIPSSVPSPAVVKDKETTFSIKNKTTIKKTAKIKIKDKDKIKKVTLNGKKVKIKANKTSVTVKLKSYKKLLKKKGKWNTLVVFDKKGNKKTIKFKTK